MCRRRRAFCCLTPQMRPCARILVRQLKTSGTQGQLTIHTSRNHHHRRRAFCVNPTRSPTFSVMFSPEASLQSARSSLRGNRRRQRDSNGHDQPRRKRSKLGEDGASQITAGSDSKTNGSAHVNGYAAGPESADSSLVLVDMPVREKKSAPKRVVKEDSTQYLVRSSTRMASFKSTS